MHRYYHAEAVVVPFAALLGVAQCAYPFGGGKLPPGTIAFEAGAELTVTSTSWYETDEWLHGETGSGQRGAFPAYDGQRRPTVARKSMRESHCARAAASAAADPECVRVHTGSVRGRGWGRFFEEVKANHQGEAVGVFLAVGETVILLHPPLP